MLMLAFATLLLGVMLGFKRSAASVVTTFIVSENLLMLYPFEFSTKKPKVSEGCVVLGLFATVDCEFHQLVCKNRC